jgi:hypothetical protein
MNVSVTAKGLAQWDVTAENDDPDAADADLKQAIERCRFSIAQAGLIEAGREVEKK